MRTLPFGFSPGWFLCGTCLVLLAGPAGDWWDLLGGLLWHGFSAGSGDKYDKSLGLDRIPGWIVLGLGWCCIAHGLTPQRSSPGDAPSLARGSFRLRLATAILGTAALYFGLAYHFTPALAVTIEVKNPPPGAALRVRAIATRRPWNPNRYAETFDYLFAAPRPKGFVVTPASHETISEFQFPAGRLSLMNWQPVASQVTVGAHDLQQRKATMVVVYLDSSLDYSDTIAVEPHSLEPCKNLVRETRGGCLVQTFPYSPRSRNLRIIVDLAGIALEPYQDGAFYNVERDFGRKFDVGRKY